MSEACQKEDKCPILKSLNATGGKWKVPILWRLYHADLRYNELKRQLDGITNIMLTRCLRDLEKAGLVRRIQFSEMPPHVEYSLTEYSRKLGSALSDAVGWAGPLPPLQQKNE